MMDCAGYGPCAVPGLTGKQQVQYTWYEPAACASVTPEMVLSRLCGRMDVDEPIYHQVRVRIRVRVRVRLVW